MDNIPDNVFKYIQKEAEKIKYGKITIELNENGPFIDVITEERRRFGKKNTREFIYKPPEYRNG